MKKYLFILATAAIAVSCSENDSFKEIDTQDTVIGFTTYTGKLTRAAENSSATKKYNLEDYNTTFKVWGYKIVNGTETPVMGAVAGNNNTYTYPGQLVEHKEDSTDPAVTEGWYYTPVRFWDKSATSYSFYAASPNEPTGASWVWDNATKKVSIANFAITGYNSVTGDPATEVDSKKVLTANLTTEDLMISTDVTGHKTYTNAPVMLDFNHILSRLNIGVRKASTLDNYEVKLNSIKVYNMKSNGSFDESLASGTDLSSGTIARWATAPTTPTKFKAGVGYTPASALTITSTATTASTKYQYVYEGLAIPQSVAYNKTVEVNDYVADANPKQFKLDGTNKSDDSDPYIVIDYEIWSTGTGAAKLDGYVYYYNLADVFNGDATTAVNFCEGWQNTLNITLAPAAINFDAQVYEWVTKTETGVDIQ